MISKPSRNRLVGLLLTVFAVGLLLSSGWLVYNDARTTYQLRVIDSHDTRGDSEALAHENLPPEAKTAFEKARNGSYETYHKPAYLNTFPLTTPVDVRSDGTTYELWATRHGFSGASLFSAVLRAVAGIILGTVGKWLYRHDGRGIVADLTG